MDQLALVKSEVSSQKDLLSNMTVVVQATLGMIDMDRVGGADI